MLSNSRYVRLSAFLVHLNALPSWTSLVLPSSYSAHTPPPPFLSLLPLPQYKPLLYSVHANLDSLDLPSFLCYSPPLPSINAVLFPPPLAPPPLHCRCIGRIKKTCLCLDPHLISQYLFQDLSQFIFFHHDSRLLFNWVVLNRVTS